MLSVGTKNYMRDLITAKLRYGSKSVNYKTIKL